MSIVGQGELDKTVQKAVEWLKDVEDELHLDRDDSFEAVRAVFHSLRDRLPVTEAVELGAQLPVLLRGVYYDGWRPVDKPDKVDRNQFLGRVDCELNRQEPDMQRQDPVRITKGVFRMLEKRITGGELKDVKDNMPKDMLTLWSEPTR
ncbi:MAG: DUF2267 domain-containing protein [Deltaproteobacteria bacterium]